MSEFTIYTENDRPGSADVPPFIVGDSTAWAIRFERPDGTTYVPSSVSVRVGHINGLPDGNYPAAFTWTDRCDNQHIATITVTAGVPVVTWNTAPIGGMVGADGVYLVRGQIPDGKVYDFTANGKLLSLKTNETLVSNITNVTFFSDGRTVATGRVEWTAAKYDIKLLVINMGSGYITAPTVVFTGGGGTGMAAQAVLNEFGGVQALRLTSLGSNYEYAPVVSFTGGGGGTGASASATFVTSQAGSLKSVNLNNGGSGYSSAPDVTLIDENNGSGAQVEAIGYDTVTDIKITAQGTNYTSPIAVTIAAPGTADGVTATASPLVLGAISNVSYINQNIPTTRYPSADYTFDETVSFDTGGCVFVVTFGQTWYQGQNWIKAISTRVIVAGSNYSTPPTKTLYGIKFTGAIALASVKITNPGSGYTSAPAVTFTGSGSTGSGMQAVATIGKITGLNIVNPGSGYDVAPGLVISGGGGSGAKGTCILYETAGQYRIILTEVTSTTKLAVTTPAILGDVNITNKITKVGSSWPINNFISTINAGVESAETPYKRAESSAAIVGAVRLTSHSDGRCDENGALQYDHSALVVLPRTIASANFTTGTDSSGAAAAVGTLNPVNAHVTARLAMRRVTTLDLQVFGDGRMLFQGSIPIVQKIV